MGLTYYAKDQSVESFDVNISGTELLGLIHQAAGAELSTSSIGDYPNVRFVQTARGCHKCAQALRLLSTDQLKKLAKSRQWGGGPFRSFRKFVDSWIDFQERCGGYHTDPPASWFNK